jgi:hypothetical protein
MATIVAPQPASFKQTVADVYGDRDGTPPAPLAADRAMVRETIASVASRAKAAMAPALHSRIDAAQKLVLSGDVELLPDGKAQVASQSNGQTTYFVVNGACTCKDFAKALDGWCKHRLASAIAKRVRQALAIADVQLAAQQDDDPPQDDAHPTSPPVEPPAGEPTPDMQLLQPYVVQIHGRPFVRYAGLLLMAHARGLQTIEARFVSVSATLAVAEATATFTDGRRLTEASDATPENVGPQVKAHFARLALTRAKARALKDALGVDLCSLEELD